MGSPKGTVLVTGASSGLGLECAKALASSGFQVYGAARSFPEGVARHETGFKTLRMDVCDDASVEKALAAILKDSGRSPDALVNNAGYGLAGSAEDSSLEEAKALFDTNFFGALRVAKAVLPHMRACGSGLIVNVGSMAGRIPLPFQGLYSASKAAIAALSEAMAAELRPFGIRVALVEPGDFASPFTSKRGSVKGAGEGSHYKKAFDPYIMGAAKRESEGMPAAEVARAICEIVEGRRKGFRRLIGSPSEKLAVHLKPYIPKKAFDKMLEDHYKL